MLVKLLLVLTLIATSAFAGPRSVVSRPVINIYSGPDKGTYVQFARDIATSCPAYDIIVKETPGSVYNVGKLTETPTINIGYRLALIQSDVFLQAPSGLAIVSPLYMEDLSIIANTTSGVHSLKDLAGKKVAVGMRNSGTWASAEALRAALGITWNSYELSPNDSIMSLLVGDIDAMIIMAGHPVPLLMDLGPSVREFIKFIDIAATKLPGMWSPTVVPKFYEWQQTPINGFATRAMLLAAPDVPTPIITGIRQCLKTNLPTLRKLGHPKWKDVELR